MSGKKTQNRTLGVKGIVIHPPATANGQRWQVSIESEKRNSVSALNASFAKNQQRHAESYVRHLMRILKTDQLSRVA